MTVNPLDPDLYGNARAESNGLPHDMYEYLRGQAPCIWVDLPDPELIDGTWVVSRYADVREVAASSAEFTDAAGTTTHKFAQSNPKVGKPSLLTMEDPDHKRVRSIVQGAFTPRVVRIFEEQLRSVTAATRRCTASAAWRSRSADRGALPGRGGAMSIVESTT